jgi:hypothetical protein
MQVFKRDAQSAKLSDEKESLELFVITQSINRDKDNACVIPNSFRDPMHASEEMLNPSADGQHDNENKL